MFSRHYRTTSQLEADYLRITAQGRYALRRSERLIEYVGAEAARTQRRRVLVDCSQVRESVPNSDRITLGTLVVEALRGLTVAFIDITEAPDKFIENIAANRGAVVAVFDTERDALAWLLAE